MTLGAVSYVLWPEGQDVLLIDRPPLPTAASVFSSHLTGSNDYTFTVYDLDSATPTTALLTETAIASTASTSNVSTQPILQTAVQAPTATYGGIWQQDATGYTLLYRILQSELSTAMEGGHRYKAEVKLVTTLYGAIYARWLISCVSLTAA